MTGEQRVIMTSDPNGAVSYAWSDGWTLSGISTETRRALGWTMRAFGVAWERVHEHDTSAFHTWTAAVEAVWWLVAIDEALDGQIGPRYRAVRDQDDDGRVMQGLRWLRHQHAHQVVVTGSGGPMVDAFGRDRPDGPEPGVALYLSPDYCWRTAEAICGEDGKDRADRAAYEAHVAGRPLQTPLLRASDWLNRAAVASGLGVLGIPTDSDDDPSVL